MFKKKIFFWAQQNLGKHQKFGGIVPETSPWLRAWSVDCQIALVLTFLTDASAKLQRGRAKRYAFALSV